MLVLTWESEWRLYSPKRQTIVLRSFYSIYINHLATVHFLYFSLKSTMSNVSFHCYYFSGDFVSLTSESISPWWEWAASVTLQGRITYTLTIIYLINLSYKNLTPLYVSQKLLKSHFTFSFVNIIWWESYNLWSKPEEDELSLWIIRLYDMLQKAWMKTAIYLCPHITR